MSRRLDRLSNSRVDVQMSYSKTLFILFMVRAGALSKGSRTRVSPREWPVDEHLHVRPPTAQRNCQLQLRKSCSYTPALMAHISYFVYTFNITRKEGTEFFFFSLTFFLVRRVCSL
jgi:hypothetical protein